MVATFFIAWQVNTMVYDAVNVTHLTSIEMKYIPGDQKHLHVGAPQGCNYKLRSQSKLEKDWKRKNYNIHYRYNKNMSAFETSAIRKEVQKAVKYFLLIFISPF